MEVNRLVIYFHLIINNCTPVYRLSKSNDIIYMNDDSNALCKPKTNKSDGANNLISDNSTWLIPNQSYQFQFKSFLPTTFYHE